VLDTWTARLRADAAGEFPERVTAFRAGHGRARPLRPAVPGLRYEHPADPLRRERNELLSALPDRRRILSDRSLARLLKDDWPRTIEELERRR
jgi:formamidopyrimidine-DNA glycosylase